MTPATMLAQRQAALAKANERKLLIAAYRKAFRDGTLDLAAVMMDPPAILAHEPIVDLIRLYRPGRAGGRSMAWFERIGRKALSEGVNLCLPLGSTSLRTREWVAREAVWHRSGLNGIPRRDKDVVA